MCDALLCDIYTNELKGARKRLSRLRKLKRWGKDATTIDLEIVNAKEWVNGAKAKIDALHNYKQEE